MSSSKVWGIRIRGVWCQHGQGPGHPEILLTWPCGMAPLAGLVAWEKWAWQRARSWSSTWGWENGQEAEKVGEGGGDRPDQGRISDDIHHEDEQYLLPSAQGVQEVKYGGIGAISEAGQVQGWLQHHREEDHEYGIRVLRWRRWKWWLEK